MFRAHTRPLDHYMSAKLPKHHRRTTRTIEYLRMLGSGVLIDVLPKSSARNNKTELVDSSEV